MNTQTMTLKERIEYYLSFFETIKRGEDDIVVLKDNAPEELRDAIYKAHGDKLPNDWIYEKFERILSSLADYNVNTIEDVEDNRGEIVDSAVDISNYDLLEWSKSYYEYIDEAVLEYGLPDSKDFDFMRLISIGQIYHLEQIFNTIGGLLEK